MITQMDPALEIRKLPPSIVRELALILDYADSWKRLMAIIPKRLSSSAYTCNITADNLAKYNSEDFKIIEQGKDSFKRPCTEILIDEWGTSGRPRATLGHLKYLLTKAQLFRAADYVAKLLNEAPPPRPTSGPAAFIPLSLSEITQQQIEPDPLLSEIEKQLDEINYPNIAIAKIRKTCDEIKSPSNVIPEIVVSDVDNSLNNPSVLVPELVPLIIQREKSKTITEVSDMIKFSHSNIVEPPDVVPELSVLLEQSPVTDLAQNSSTAIDQSTVSGEFTPAFSQILGGLPSQIQDEQSIPVLSQLLEQSQPQNDCDIYSTTDNNIPNISVLNQNSFHSESNFIPSNIPDISLLNQNSSSSDSDLIPNFDLLQSKMTQSSNSNIPISITIHSSDSASKCPSPLPNLSLNTELPHFSYSELQTATNNFSDTPFTTEKEHGGFLGSGAFGSVFLAIGLLNEPVAVKKIFLENVEIVNEDDEVTKQFKNEVEFLSKYKHENLVSLLGYSCDGCTYCLVYEYVSGGALFDTLEKNSLSLKWKQRMHIALGTAKAVAYLHTAFSAPLIHRDIKTANILLDACNNPKLCDFGIVKLLPSQKTDTQTALYGTSAYMSPEYHRGDISIKLDTFSFGVVLLELLTSLPPLDYKRQGADLVTYVEEKCEESIDPILDKSIGTWEENDINFAKELYNLTLKCLEDKKKRPLMVEVVEALEQIIRNLS